MNCEIFDTLYLRANGDVPCNDDAGENVLLGLVRPHQTQWSAASLLFNHRYRHMRDSFSRGETPWPGVCDRCAFFRPNEPYVDRLFRRRIRKIQVEPSLACRLRCPSCSNQHQVRVRPQPLLMDLTMFQRVLTRLRDEDFTVQQLEYCGQGEPLVHDDFSAFVRAGRVAFPNAYHRLITSGNFDYSATIRDERVDEVMVSCDGLLPESYHRYRAGGDVSVALKFMRDAIKAPVSPRMLVIWKYILFEWNDSPEEIQAASAKSSCAVTRAPIKPGLPPQSDGVNCARL